MCNGSVSQEFEKGMTKRSVNSSRIVGVVVSQDGHVLSLVC